MTKFDQGKFQPVDPKKVTAEDVQKIFAMDSVYANKYYVTVQADGMVRICFADTDPSGNFMTPRFSVVLPFMAFASFAQLIADNMKNVAQAQQIMASMGSEKGN